MTFDEWWEEEGKLFFRLPYRSAMKLAWSAGQFEAWRKALNMTKGTSCESKAAQRAEAGRTETT
jgi:hypothetical protein